jgi:hypothetical protein
MDIAKEVAVLIGRPAEARLEYKAVLPPARTVAQLICSFANSQGGFIVLGVAHVGGKLKINGLSEEFRATAITHNAIDLLSPRPGVNYEYVFYEQKRLYVIKVEKSDTPIALEGKVYVREGAHSVLKTAPSKENNRYPRIKKLSSMLKQYKKQCTSAKAKYLDHYQSVLNILDDLGSLLYPESPQKPTTSQEGKVLMRILFSSCADNFETYMHEFVDVYAKKKLAKLQRGSVKGFIADNPQIKGLGVFNDDLQDGIEKLLQIRHLYSHRNGIVDEKFLRYYPDLKLNDEHQMPLDDFLEKFEYLAQTIDAVDMAGLTKYQLASLG